MGCSWDWEREYHIGRKDSAFYIIDDNGVPLEGPYQSLEFHHIAYSNSDHIKAVGESGKEFLTKDGQEYDWPTNLTLSINIGDNK